MIQVKICGLTMLDDALYAAEMGADMLGFIFATVSKRYISPDAAQPIIAHIRQKFAERAPLCVGVFVADGDIEEACRKSGVDAAQVVGMAQHLSQLTVPVYACIRPETAEQALIETAQFELRNNPPDLPTLQLDAFHPNLYGGTGHTAPKAVMQAVVKKTARLMLAGGLTPENVVEFIREVQPWAVDVASGTETAPGKKDFTKVRKFIENAKRIG